MQSKLPPIEQEWFDDNRERFSAFSQQLPKEGVRCAHDLYRKASNEVGCRKCTVGWFDNGELPVK